MGRLPFDPDKLPDRKAGGPARRERAGKGRGDGGAGGGAADDAMTVSQLSGRIKDVVTRHIESPVKVVGEISNLNRRGHWFFSLKDSDAVVPCVMWRSAAAKLRVDVEDGQEVVATGRVDYYPPHGKLQIYVDRIEPVGMGMLELKLRQLMERLREAGYFAEERKKALPSFPTRVAVITSETSAALQDVIRTAQQRWAGCELLLVDARMQGAASAPSVAKAIRWLGAAREQLGIDAIIVTRGGGSLEDLWAFNERIVADAIYHCPVPIVAAIGHETDTTVAELVADRRCSTPTQAAAVLVPDARHEGQRLSDYTDRLRLKMRRALERQAERLTHVRRHALFRRPGELVEQTRHRLAFVEQRLGQAVTQRTHAERRRLAEARHTLAQHSPKARLRTETEKLTGAAHRLASLIRYRHDHATQQLSAIRRELDAVNPRGVLQRGYTYTTTPDGRVIRAAGQTRAGDVIVTHFADEQIHSQVLADPDAKKPVRKKRARKKKADEEQGGLFGD